MTVLEELIDAALNVCEKSRQSAHQQQAHTHSRSAVALTSTGKTYTGCDVHIASVSGASESSHGVSAERAAILAAVADGAAKFDVRKLTITPPIPSRLPYISRTYVTLFFTIAIELYMSRNDLCSAS